MVPEYSNPELRVGVVGASGWADVAHLPALAGTPGLRVAAVATSREDSAREVATRWDVPAWSTSAAELAARDDVDLITVSVKAPLHRRLIEEVLPAGKPVLCEWPMGTSPEEAALLADLFAASGTPGFVGLQAAVNPVLAEIGQLVADGSLGTVLSVAFRASRASKEPVPTASAYTLQAHNGAGMLEILGGHGVAAMLTALGEDLSRAPLPVDGLSTVVKREYRGVDGTTIHATSADTAAAVLDLAPGAATLTLADGDIDPSSDITIIGTGGRVHARTLPAPELRLRQPQMAEWTAEVTTPEGTKHIHAPASRLPLAARNPARLYQAIRHDLEHGTQHAPRAADAVRIHQVLDGLR